MKRTISIILPALVFIFFLQASCEKSNDNSGPEEAYVIGYDPCTVIYDTTENAWVGSQGYIVTLSERKDTVLTYNLPDTLFVFPSWYFETYIWNCFFPESEWKTYKMRIEYEYVEEDDRFIPFCFAHILTSIISNVTDRRTQIKIKHVTR